MDSTQFAHKNTGQPRKFSGSSSGEVQFRLRNLPAYLAKDTAHDNDMQHSSTAAQVLFRLTAQACIVIAIAALAALVVFLIFFRAPPVVSVPNLMGKSFVDAAILLQEKQLYPAVFLQYTNDPLDKDKVIGQDPQHGMAIRAKREVSVTISRGAVIEQIPDYKGEKYSHIIERMSLQPSSLTSFAEFAGARKLFHDDVPADIIMAQDPPAGSKITGKGVRLSFVVSRGARDMTAVMPDISGLSFDEIFDVIQNVNIPIEFYIVERDISLPTESEYGAAVRKAGVIVEQLPSPGIVLSSSGQQDFRIRIGIRPKATSGLNQNQSAQEQRYNAGILRISLPRYNTPRAIVIKRRAVADSSSWQSVSLHTQGGTVTFPYFVIPGTLYEAQVEGSTVWRYTVPGTQFEEAKAAN